MHVPQPQSSSPSGLRLPRRTARLRLTILYGGVCLLFGAILIAVISLLTWGAVTLTAHATPVAAASPSPASRSAQQGNQDGAAEQITVDRRLLLTRSGIALVIVSAAAVGAGWLLAGRVLRPLSTITAAARRISASSLHERLALQGPTMSSRNSATPWTACSRGLRRRSTPSGASPPTPRTSCARP